MGSLEERHLLGELLMAQIERQTNSSMVGALRRVKAYKTEQTLFLICFRGKGRGVM